MLTHWSGLAVGGQWKCVFSSPQTSSSSWHISTSFHLTSSAFLGYSLFPGHGLSHLFELLGAPAAIQQGGSQGLVSWGSCGRWSRSVESQWELAAHPLEWAELEVEAGVLLYSGPALSCPPLRL